MSFYVCVLFACIAVIHFKSSNGQGNPAEQQVYPRLENAYGKCKAELGLKEENGQVHLTNIMAMGGGDGCSLSCIYTNMGFFTNNVVDEAKVMEDVKKFATSGTEINMAQELIHQCSEASAKETDKCKFALNFAKCVFTKGGEIRKTPVKQH